MGLTQMHLDASEIGKFIAGEGERATPIFEKYLMDQGSEKLSEQVTEALKANLMFIDHGDVALDITF
jgi:hypothetical protein